MKTKARSTILKELVEVKIELCRASNRVTALEVNTGHSLLSPGKTEMTKARQRADELYGTQQALSWVLGNDAMRPSKL